VLLMVVVRRWRAIWRAVATACWCRRRSKPPEAGRRRWACASCRARAGVRWRRTVARAWWWRACANAAKLMRRRRALLVRRRVAMRLRRRRIMLLYVLILLLARRAQLFGGRAVRQRVEAVTVDAEQIREAANHEWIFNVRNGGRRDLLARPNVDDAAVRTDREIRL
jgi:hypothetical protein